MTQHSSKEQDAEIIDLLMREYESLRAEITERVSSRMQVLGYSGVIAALLATGGLSVHKPNLYLSSIAILLGLLWLRDCNQGIQRIGAHLREVEAEVNRRSVRAFGSTALSWETQRHIRRRRERPVWRSIGHVGGWS